MMRAPTSGLLRQWRCHSPSASVKERSERRWNGCGGGGPRGRRGGGLGPGALLAELGQRRAAGRLQQVVLGGGVGRGGVGDGARLLRRQLSPAGGGRRLGQGSRRRAVSRAAAAWTTVVPVRRASWWAAERSPSLRHEPHLGHPGRGQGLDGGGHLLDPRRLLHHFRGLGRRQHGRVEAGRRTHSAIPAALRSPRPKAPSVRERATYRGRTERDSPAHVREVGNDNLDLGARSAVPRPPRPRPAGAASLSSCGRWRRTAACGERSNPGAVRHRRVRPVRRRPRPPLTGLGLVVEAVGGVVLAASGLVLLAHTFNEPDRRPLADGRFWLAYLMITGSCLVLGPWSFFDGDPQTSPGIGGTMFVVGLVLAGLFSGTCSSRCAPATAVRETCGAATTSSGRRSAGSAPPMARPSRSGTRPPSGPTTAAPAEPTRTGRRPPRTTTPLRLESAGG